MLCFLFDTGPEANSGVLLRPYLSARPVIVGQPYHRPTPLNHSYGQDTEAYPDDFSTAYMDHTCQPDIARKASEILRIGSFQ